MDEDEDEEIPSIISDGSRIVQILLNLENAINYTEKGSIFLKVRSKKNNVYVTIEDTGMGIPKEELPLIFERFHRVENILSLSIRWRSVKMK